VGLDFAGREVPDPLPPTASKLAGYAVTLHFPSHQTTVREVAANLTDGTGAVVPVHFSSPEEPARAGVPQGNAIFLIPVAPLKPGTTYTATVTATVDGLPFGTQWSFTTVPRQSLRDVPTLLPTAFALDGITLDAPVAAELFNEQVGTLTGTMSGTPSAFIGIGVRPVGTTGSFIVLATAPVVEGRFRLDIVFYPDDVGAYEVLLFRSGDGIAFQGTFSVPARITVF
jgi:hypothetical protein